MKLWGKVMSPREIKQLGTRMELRSTKMKGLGKSRDHQGRQRGKGAAAN